MIMAYGIAPKRAHTLPAGRRSFTDSAGPAPQIVRPGTYSDGQAMMGTPAGRESTKASESTYASGAAYRAALRGDTDRGLTGRTESVGPNPQVKSKAVKRYGVDGSELPGATNRSTGVQPAPLDRGGNIPGALPARDLKAGKPATERVGYVNGTYKVPTFPNTGKHFQGAPVITRSLGVSKLDTVAYTGATKRGPGTK
jgi:hypothetical protein